MADLCSLIGDHFDESILPHSSIAGENLNVRFQAATIEEATRILAFLTGKEVRQKDGFYFLGGEGEDKLVSLPSAGLNEGAAKLLGEQNTAIVGQSVVFKGDEAAIADATEVIEDLQKREDDITTAHFRLVVVDVSERDRKPVGEWLEVFEAVGNIEVSGATDLLTGAVLNQNAVAAGAVSLGSFVELVERLKRSEVVTDTILQLVDESKVVVTAGQVLEREVTERVPTDSGTSSNFRTGFDRLNIGFDLEIQPIRLLSGWRLGVKASDSALTNGQETRTEFEGECILRDVVSGPNLLADLARAGKSSTHRRPNIFPLSLFAQKAKNRESRRLLIFMEPHNGKVDLPERSE